MSLGNATFAIPDYREFLSQLAGVANKLPALWLIIMDIVADVQRGIELMTGKAVSTTEGPVGVPKLLLKHTSFGKVDKEVKDLEAKVLKLMRSDDDKLDESIAEAEGEKNEGRVKLKAIGDGQLIALLRNLYSFIQQNPALWNIILNLLIKPQGT